MKTTILKMFFTAFVLAMSIFVLQAQSWTIGTNNSLYLNPTTANLGIGVSNATQKLEVNGTIKANAITGTSTGGTLRIQTTSGYLDLGAENTGWAHFRTDRPNFYFDKPIYLNNGILSSYGTTNLSLQTNGTNRITVLNSNGNVGIGTTAPAAKLHIINNQAASSVLYGINTSVTNTDLNSTSNSYGVRTDISSKNKGQAFGNYIVVSNDNASTTSNTIGTRIQTDVYGLGPLYGSYSISTNNNTTSTASSLGVQTSISTKTKGNTFGNYILVSNDNTSSAASTYGIYSDVKVSGSSALYGFSSSATNNNTTSTANSYGVRTNVSSKNKGHTFGNHIVVSNDNASTTSNTIGTRTQTDVYGSGPLYGSYSISNNNNTTSTANSYGARTDISSKNKGTTYGHYVSAGNDNTSTVCGVYSAVSGGGKKWAGYFTGGDMYVSGNVGIGTTNPQNKLEVNGTIRAKEVIVENTNWPDYVFSPDYQLPSLESVSKHIQVFFFFPNIPSAAEVAEQGVNLSEMSTMLLQKIEELTLYAIQQQEMIDVLKEKVEQLETKK